LLNIVCYEKDTKELWFSGTYDSMAHAITALITRCLGYPMIFEEVTESKIVFTLVTIDYVIEEGVDLSTSKQEPEIYIGNH